jgi:hypothetical protein
MEWRHLQQTPPVWAVAGGQVKREVLWTLLICRYITQEKTSTVVKEMSTDLESAKELLRAHEAFDELPGDLKRWYQDMVPKVFSDELV